jgi:2-methylcitrate dehydratase PrpD
VSLDPDRRAESLMMTRRLAEFAAGIDYAALPEAVRVRARMSVLDGLGVILGAVHFTRRTGDLRLENYLELAATPGPATAIGYGRRIAPLVAAFVNGTASEVLDFSDCILTARSHPGAAILPCALALVEGRRISGASFMAAMMAAYEAHTRVCHAIQPSQWFRGFQSTSAIGAALVGAHLLRLDAQGLADAMGAGGFVMPILNGDNVFRGHSVKPVLGGQAASAGLSAALLAASGYAAGPLEGEPPRFHGPLPVTCDFVDQQRAIDRLGTEWRCLEVAYKPYPIGLLITGAVEICIDWAQASKVRAEDIERVDVVTYKEAAHFVAKYTTPASSYVDCHLSMPYCVAIALLDGTIGLRQLEDERIRDGRVHDLARRVHVHTDAEMSKQYPHEWPVTVTVHFTNGETLSRHLDQVKGSPRRPPTWDEIVEKFMSMAEPVIGRDRANRAAEYVGELDRANDVAELLDLVR